MYSIGVVVHQIQNEKGNYVLVGVRFDNIYQDMRNMRLRESMSEARKDFEKRVKLILTTTGGDKDKHIGENLYG